MSYDVQILVNGSRCKQYNHNGKLFIEAKHGSEYVIEVKNHSWQRIMAVCSVDGLDILDGKPAREDAGGYVIPPYGADKFSGFRVSNDKVAKFVFSTKGSSYAASKEDGSERNVGVVGIRLFEEKAKPLPPPPVEVHHHHWPKVQPWNPYNPYYGTGTIWTDNTYSTSIGSDTLKGGTIGASVPDDMKDCLGWMEMDMDSGPTKGGGEKYCGGPPKVKGGESFADKFKKLAGTKISADTKGLTRGLMDTSCCKSAPERERGFDMGTKWGEAKESRVTEVEFERGFLVLSTNIYYASRQSLIEMGVPLGNEAHVSFPEPFADGKYAKPPKNWIG